MFKVIVRFLLSSVLSFTVPTADGKTGEMLNRNVLEHELRVKVIKSIAISPNRLFVDFEIFIDSWCK